MFQYEIYEVPNEELDGNEIFVTECHDKSVAFELTRHHRLKSNHPVWLIQISSDETEKVIST